MNKFLSLTTVLLILTSSFSFSQENIQEIVFEGQYSLEQAGSCKMSSAPIEVKIIISIDNNTGEFTGKEFWKSEEGIFIETTKRKWTGQVLNKQALRLRLEVKPNCGGKPREETLHFIGVINCDESTCSMNLEDTYVMCPSSNCIFKIQYDLKLIN
ncbi:MAG: hypothetical protein WDZ45_11100 [Flavobacteriaceae bacterium]